MFLGPQAPGGRLLAGRAAGAGGGKGDKTGGRGLLRGNRLSRARRLQGCGGGDEGLPRKRILIGASSRRGGGGAGKGPGGRGGRPAGDKGARGRNFLVLCKWGLASTFWPLVVYGLRCLVVDRCGREQASAFIIMNCRSRTREKPSFSSPTGERGRYGLFFWFFF